MEAIRVQEGMSKVMSKRVVDEIFESIKNILSEGDIVQLRGFGTFKKVTRKARVVINPHTGKEINVPACERIVFKASRIGS